MHFRLPRTLRAQQKFELKRFITSLKGKDQKGWRKLSHFDALDNDLEFFIASHLHGLSGNPQFWCNGAAIEQLKQKGKHHFYIEASIWLLPYNANSQSTDSDYYFLSGFFTLHATKPTAKQYKLILTNGTTSLTVKKGVL